MDFRACTALLAVGVWGCGELTALFDGSDPPPTDAPSIAKTTVIRRAVGRSHVREIVEFADRSAVFVGQMDSGASSGSLRTADVDPEALIATLAGGASAHLVPMVYRQLSAESTNRLRAIANQPGFVELLRDAEVIGDGDRIADDALGRITIYREANRDIDTELRAIEQSIASTIDGVSVDQLMVDTLFDGGAAVEALALEVISIAESGAERLNRVHMSLKADSAIEAAPVVSEPAREAPVDAIVRVLEILRQDATAHDNFFTLLDLMIGDEDDDPPREDPPDEPDPTPDPSNDLMIDLMGKEVTFMTSGCREKSPQERQVFSGFVEAGDIPLPISLVFDPTLESAQFLDTERRCDSMNWRNTTCQRVHLFYMREGDNRIFAYSAELTQTRERPDGGTDRHLIQMT